MWVLTRFQFTTVSIGFDRKKRKIRHLREALAAVLTNLLTAFEYIPHYSPIAKLGAFSLKKIH